MKKVLVSLIIVMLFCTCSCRQKNKNLNYESGVWISYYELNTMLANQNNFKREFEKVINNCKNLDIENIYLHTRAFGETIYHSDYFPILKCCENLGYDVFEYIVGECKKAGLKIHAWINPYRISADSNTENLDKTSPAYKWLKDEDKQNDKNIGFANGIYFNPASTQVRKLVLDEIRELIAKYNIDGIHFDDYFYPTQNEDFDKSSFECYKAETYNFLSLENWRRENVNTLIASCYNTIKYANQDIVFSISPTASVENNYENLYADVKVWIKEGLIDEIIPQLYFGFEYPDQSYRFENLLVIWKNLTADNPNVKLKIGLANYKAKPTLDADKAEWQNNSDIIARQVQICQNDKDISGYVYFSYSSLFGEDEEYKAQRDKIKEIGEF